MYSSVPIFDSHNSQTSLKPSWGVVVKRGPEAELDESFWTIAIGLVKGELRYGAFANKFQVFVLILLRFRSFK